MENRTYLRKDIIRRIELVDQLWATAQRLNDLAINAETDAAADVAYEAYWAEANELEKLIAQVTDIREDIAHRMVHSKRRELMKRMYALK